MASGTAVAVPVFPKGLLMRIKPLTSIHRVTEALIGPDSPEGIAVSHRVAVMHYVLDMG